MSESYKRRCKWCGKWINLRQMPAGQWVAFEGYDTPHKCTKDPTVVRGSSHPSYQYQSKINSDINPYMSYSPKSDSKDNGGKSDIWSWVIGIGIVILIGFLLSR